MHRVPRRLDLRARRSAPAPRPPVDLSIRRHRRRRRGRRGGAGDRAESTTARPRLLLRPLADRAADGEPRRSRPVDERFWRARLESAIAFRERLAIDASAWRLVHGEGDLVPSLIVDRYADVLVMQTLSQGTERLLPTFARLLTDLTGARGVLERNDPRVRGARRAGPAGLGGARRGARAVLVHEGPVEYEVDLRHAQKTGLFLDQRENHAAAAGYARGRLLDAFSYHGGFALAMAAGCTRVDALDVSEAAVAQIRANAAPQPPAPRRGARGQCLRRAAAARQGRRALRDGGARPPGLRQEQGGAREGARRLQGDQPAGAAAARAGRDAGDLHLLVPRRRRACSPPSCTRPPSMPAAR